MVSKRQLYGGGLRCVEEVPWLEVTVEERAWDEGSKGRHGVYYTRCLGP